MNFRSWVWDVLNTAITRLELHLSSLKNNEKRILEKIDILKYVSEQKDDGEVEDEQMEDSGILFYFFSYFIAYNLILIFYI